MGAGEYLPATASRLRCQEVIISGIGRCSPEEAWGSQPPRSTYLVSVAESQPPAAGSIIFLGLGLAENPGSGGIP